MDLFANRTRKTAPVRVAFGSLPLLTSTQSAATPQFPNPKFVNWNSRRFFGSTDKLLQQRLQSDIQNANRRMVPISDITMLGTATNKEMDSKLVATYNSVMHSGVHNLPIEDHFKSECIDLIHLAYKMNLFLRGYVTDSEGKLTPNGHSDFFEIFHSKYAMMAFITRDSASNIQPGNLDTSFSQLEVNISIRDPTDDSSLNGTVDQLMQKLTNIEEHHQAGLNCMVQLYLLALDQELRAMHDFEMGTNEYEAWPMVYNSVVRSGIMRLDSAKYISILQSVVAKEERHQEVLQFIERQLPLVDEGIEIRECTFIQKWQSVKIVSVTGHGTLQDTISMIGTMRSRTLLKHDYDEKMKGSNVEKSEYHGQTGFEMSRQRNTRSFRGRGGSSQRGRSLPQGMKKSTSMRNLSNRYQPLQQMQKQESSDDSDEEDKPQPATNVARVVEDYQ